MFRLHHLTIYLLLVISTSAAKDESSVNELDPITSTSSSTSVDPKLRRALLKALSDLQNEGEKTPTKQEEDAGDNNSQLSTIDKVHSTLTVVTASEDRNVSSVVETTGTEPSKPLVVVQKSNGIQQKPIIQYVLPTNHQPYDPFNETILTSASSSFEPKDSRSASHSNSITDERKFVGSKAVETTTVTTTSSTEESEAKVEDVQFFSAPLVAAFTVHQDERGLPKSVVPIYKTSGNHQVPTTHQQRYAKQQEQLNLKQEERQQHIALQEKQKLLEQQLAKLQQQTLQQQSLLLKQQQLFQEQQLKLQKQLLQNHNANNNNQLTTNFFNPTSATGLSGNRPFAPVKSADKQRPIDAPFDAFLPTTVPTPSFFGGFANLRQTTSRPIGNLIQKSISGPASSTVITNQPSFHNQATFVDRPNSFGGPLTNHLPTAAPLFNNNRFNGQHSQFNVHQHGQPPQSALVSFQPSIALTSSQSFNQQPLHQQPQLTPINQQLPIRNSIDFNRNPYFKTQPSPIDHSLLTLTPPSNTLIQPSITPTLRHGNRVFRHEAGTGNFLANNNQNFNQPQYRHANRFFRSNDNNFSFKTNPFGLQPPAINRQLNNLLYQSGVSGGRPSEDLNIVSKILSYNVGEVDDLYFDASGKTEKRVPAPKAVASTHR